jgi:hypothetical protein
MADYRSDHLGHSTSNLGLEVRPPMRATVAVVPSVIATELEVLLRDYLSGGKAQGMSIKTINLYRDATYRRAAAHIVPTDRIDPPGLVLVLAISGRTGKIAPKLERLSLRRGDERGMWQLMPISVREATV